MNDLFFAGRADAVDVDRAALDDVKAVRRVAFAKEILSLFQRLEHRDSGDVFQVGQRQSREQLATAKRVDESDFFEFGEILRHRGPSLSVFAPKINNPIATLSALDPRRESLAGKFLDERRWQKGRDDDESFIRLERVDAPADFGEWFDAPPQHVAHIESFELT